jgi:cell division protein FtsW (lipid II flippase)
MLRARTIFLEYFDSSSETDQASAARVEIALLSIAACFVFVGALTLSLAQEEEILMRHLYAPLIWALLMAAVYAILHKTVPAHDPVILPVVGLLTGWGLVLVDRLAPNFLPRQVTWLAISCLAMVIVASFRPILGFLQRYRYTWLTLGLVLLGATLLFGVNPSGQGATLWLKVPIFGRIFFQPSELLKLLLVTFLASYFADRGRLITLRGSSVKRWIAYLAPIGLMWSFCMLLLIWQRDLGAASLFFAVFIVLLYLATGDLRYLLAGLVLIVIAGAIGYRAYDVVDLRIDTWLNPWPEADNRGFQIVQSLYAVAAGGVLGQGAGLGFPTYIPVVHSDFAFAAVAEEWGLVGVFAVTASFTILAYRGLKIAGECKDAFQLYLAAGITVLFSVQAFLIMAGVTKLLPLTGITLPFISYGGSSLLVSAIMIGLLLNISARAGEEGSPERSLRRDWD